MHVCGPDDGTPVVLLHGGGATSTVWFANAEALAGTHRAFAPDAVGGPGRSVPAGVGVRSPADLMRWLDAVLDGLGLRRDALVGHSYGGWTALSYAVHATERVTRLVLLDPTDCFAGLRLGA